MGRSSKHYAIFFCVVTAVVLPTLFLSVVVKRVLGFVSYRKAIVVCLFPQVCSATVVDTLEPREDVPMGCVRSLMSARRVIAGISGTGLTDTTIRDGIVDF